MKGLQSKVKDLQRIIVKREDTINHLKYDLIEHKDLQADYKKLSESMKSIRRQEEELKECDKQIGKSRRRCK